MERPVWINEEKLPSAREKLVKKCKEEPFVPIGIAGTLMTLAYGAYAYKFRGPMSTSRYLMRLRVVSQSVIVGSLIVGAILTSYRKSRNHSTNSL